MLIRGVEAVESTEILKSIRCRRIEENKSEKALCNANKLEVTQIGTEKHESHVINSKRLQLVLLSCCFSRLGLSCHCSTSTLRAQRINHSDLGIYTGSNEEVQLYSLDEKRLSINHTCCYAAKYVELAQNIATTTATWSDAPVNHRWNSPKTPLKTQQVLSHMLILQMNALLDKGPLKTVSQKTS
ncbi:hypothetical protein NPIL_504881 [Nephila pilipes]|uniref:Uncharacterized protein n=1 Tax=Nephila pilipes TaxID=299642 RepID=A0A8X6P6A0_NEPPI|nr:hypothetical protein NPIL_504881 [Nephila pilipes]